METLERVDRTDEEAWAIALENEGLANKLCRRMTIAGLPRGVDFEWLKSEAWEGLFKAAKRWNPDLSKFSTYAFMAMRNHLLNAMRKHEVAQGGPRGHSSKERIAYVGSIEERRAFLGDQFSDAGDDFPEPAFLGVEDENFEKVEDRLELEEFHGRLRTLLETANLTDLQIRVLQLRLEGLEYPQIAEHMGTSKQNVHQLWSYAVRKLRKAAAA